MIMLWSTVFIFMAVAQLEVQGARNPIIPIRPTRTTGSLKCAQLISEKGGFIFYPGRGGAIPIPGTKGGLLIPGCLQIVYDLKEGKVLRAFEDLKSNDLGSAELELVEMENSDNSQTTDEVPEAKSKYPIVDLEYP